VRSPHDAIDGLGKVTTQLSETRVVTDHETADDGVLDRIRESVTVS
jgi:hypothetical protein